MLARIAAVEFYALLLASVIFWVFVIRIWRARGQFPVKQIREEMHPIGLLDVFVLLALWIGGQMLGQVIFLSRSGLTLEQLANGVYTADQMSSMMFFVKSMELVAVWFGVLFLALRYREKFWRRLSHRFCQNFGLGLVASLLILPPILGVHQLVSLIVQYEHTTLKTIADQPGWYNLVVAWFTAVLVAPIAEEILCRGGIQSWIRRLRPGAGFAELNSLIGGGQVASDDNSSETKSTGHDDLNGNADASLPDGEGGIASTDKVPDGAKTKSLASETHSWQSSGIAIVVIAGFFGFLHLGQGLAIVPLFLMALALGYLYERTRSLVPCIVVHFVLNAHSMMWATLETVVNR